MYIVQADKSIHSAALSPNVAQNLMAPDQGRIGNWFEIK